MRYVQKGKFEKPFIVKIQRSQFPDNKQFLVYDETKSVWFNTDITKNPEFAELMGRDQKAFFTAQLKGKQIEILDRAAKQEW